MQIDQVIFKNISVSTYLHKKQLMRKESMNLKDNKKVYIGGFVGKKEWINLIILQYAKYMKNLKTNFNNFFEGSTKFISPYGRYIYIYT